MSPEPAPSTPPSRGNRLVLWIGGSYLAIVGALRTLQVIAQPTRPGEPARPLELILSLLVTTAGVLLLIAAARAAASPRKAGSLGLAGAALSTLVGFANFAFYALATRPAAATASAAGERVGEIIGVVIWMLASLTIAAASVLIRRGDDGAP
jgi:hypothetical protein